MRYDVKLAESFRLSKITAEFLNAIEAMSDVKRAVGVFGSARTKPGDKYYDTAETIGRLLAENGFAVITGGGPGLMEAANKGAFEAGGTSVGLNINLPFEQHINAFVNVSVDFQYFFVRKVMFVKQADAMIVMPGGMGTFDELFEILTLVQTRKKKNFKIVLVGSDFWSGMLQWLRTTVTDDGMISPEDIDLFQVMDEPEEIIEYIKGGRP